MQGNAKVELICQIHNQEHVFSIPFDVSSEVCLEVISAFKERLESGYPRSLRLKEVKDDKNFYLFLDEKGGVADALNVLNFVGKNLEEEKQKAEEEKSVEADMVKEEDDTEA